MILCNRPYTKSGLGSIRFLSERSVQISNKGHCFLPSEVSLSKSFSFALTDVAWWGVILQSERLPTGFLVRTHAWVAGPGPSRRCVPPEEAMRQRIEVCLLYPCFFLASMYLALFLSPFTSLK